MGVHIGPLCPACRRYVMDGHISCWDLGENNMKEVKCKECGTTLVVRRFYVPQVQISLADEGE